MEVEIDLMLERNDNEKKIVYAFLVKFGIYQVEVGETSLIKF